jgi:adenylate cyclase
MADLLAQGRKPDESWRRPLPPNQPLVLGRDAGEWSVPWEPFLSRQHATLLWREGRLEVVQLPQAANPIYHEGERVTRFYLHPGQHFAVGDTTFTLVEDPAVATLTAPGLVVQERAFPAAELKRFRVRDAAHQVDVLGRLPQMIAQAANDQELFIGLASLLLTGIPRADAVALVGLPPGESPDALQLMHKERRHQAQGQFQPSHQLIADALHRKETLMKVWVGSDARTGAYTQAVGFDWAFCTPLRGEASAGWGIYVAGRFSRELAETVLAETEATELADDLKFTELLAEIWSALRQVSRLKQRQTSLSQFFSPAVVQSLAGADPDLALQPKIADVTVLFCDLRGSSREAEKHSDDLLGLLEHVRKALGLMTQNIFDQEGVIADFQGDAAMAFWGWPRAHPDRVRRACLAALGIQTLFGAVALKPNHRMANFQVGIGIATGTAVVGKVGAVDQVKVGVFGPVVNLASRLEGMTKLLHVAILLDEATARAVRAGVPAEVARVRRLAVVQPRGMETVLTVSELLPPVAEYPLLSDQHLLDYEAALDAFSGGDWNRAYDLLHRLPAQDLGKDFLLGLILRHNRRPPAGWAGFISLESKS